MRRPSRQSGTGRGTVADRARFGIRLEIGVFAPLAAEHHLARDVERPAKIAGGLPGVAVEDGRWAGHDGVEVVGAGVDVLEAGHGEHLGADRPDSGAGRSVVAVRLSGEGGGRSEGQREEARDRGGDQRNVTHLKVLSCLS